MNIRVRLSAQETRARIIDVAEEHFRRVGYAKTAVADLADVLGMSSANIYRFFPTKSAINDAICRKLLAEGQALATRIVNGTGTASERLQRFIGEVHSYNKSRYTEEHRIHEMVAIAMSENWPAIDEHCHEVCQMLAVLIAEGQASGEFASIDVAETSHIVFSCCCSLFHPTMIAECADKDQAVTAAQMSRFILRALGNSAPDTSRKV